MEDERIPQRLSTRLSRLGGHTFPLLLSFFRIPSSGKDTTIWLSTEQAAERKRSSPQEKIVVSLFV